MIELLDRTDTGKERQMLRPIFNLRAQPEPTRPARDIIIAARRRAARDTLRTWD